MLLQAIISQSSTSSTAELIDETITDLARVGDRQFVFPSILWYNNKTFIIGDKGNSGFNNDLVLSQYDHTFGSFYSRNVGNGS